MAITSLWRLNNSALTTDSVGSITLTNNGTVTESQGVVQGSMDTGTGNGKYMSSTSNSITNWNSYTISGWYSPNVQPVSREQTMATFSIGSTPNCNVIIVYGTQRIGGGVKGVSVIRSRNNVVGLAINFTITMDLGKRYYIVSTYNGTTFKLYVNGIFRASGSQSGNGSGGSTFSYIGEEPSNTTYWAGRGRMDNVSVDNSIISDGGIKTQYAFYSGFM